MFYKLKCRWKRPVMAVGFYEEKKNCRPLSLLSRKNYQFSRKRARARTAVDEIWILILLGDCTEMKVE